LAAVDWVPHLRVGERGHLLDEYRVVGGRVEVRALDPNGEPYPGYSDWITVTPEEIKQHFVKNSAVAQWLKEVLGKGRAAERGRPLAG
jgi:hypothetical protein